jgi:hypothetical protein
MCACAHNLDNVGGEIPLRARSVDADVAAAGAL